MMRRLAWLLWLAILATSGARADTRASVDRIAIRADESVTLVVETDTGQSPDLQGVMRDFVVMARSSGRSVSYAGGRVQMRQRFEYRLAPRAAGRFVIPPLRVGADTTSALVVDVGQAQPAGRSPNQRAGSTRDDVFVRTELQTTRPYTQQGFLLTVRFYIGRQLLDAALDQPDVPGLTLQQIGKDVQTTEVLGERSYQVITRHYWGVADQPGRVQIPGARLVGTTMGGFFDQTFGDGLEEVTAVGETLQLDVRAPPADARSPWLPLQQLTLRYQVAPDAPVAPGGSARVVVQMSAVGAQPADLPAIGLTADNAAQIYPEAAETEVDLRDGQLVTTVSRAFSVLPTQAGDIRVAVNDIPWWNTRTGQNARASAGTRVLRVTGFRQANASPSAGSPTAPGRADQSAKRALWGVAAGIGLGLLAALGWMAKRRGGVPKEATRKAQASTPPSGQASAAPAVSHEPSVPLPEAVASGDLQAIARALCQAGNAQGLEGVLARLADPEQRSAVAALQSALWGRGDLAQAQSALRKAFVRLPEWRVDSAPRAAAALPPLYPEG